jgi:SAM-dependent methyltransferase
MQEFMDHISEAIDGKVPFKLTLSKPKRTQSPFRNVFIRPIRLDDTVTWTATLRYLSNDKTQNYDTDALKNALITFLKESFYNADLFLPEKKITLLQSKKGKSKVLVTKEIHDVQIEQHDHQKHRLIPESVPYLHDLGISSSNGKVFGHAQDKYKQINKFVEILSNLTKADASLSSIYDMGSGKGYLTFALHDYLTQTSSPELITKGIEIREDLVQKCQAIVQKNSIKGLFFQQGSISDYKLEEADIVIALHACDIATDMAIAQGLAARAKYIVVAPCCHKQIRKAMNKTNSKLNPVLKHGILKERLAEMITDSIRALVLESKGYEVQIFEFISSEHTGKNVMLTARKTNNINPEALQKIEDLKQEFGIEFHYLEKLLG